MSFYRIFLNMLFFFMLLIDGIVMRAEAAQRPIVTVHGEEIYPAAVRHRLNRLLHELGEPPWSRKELTRLMKPVFSYLRAFTGRQFDRSYEALQRGDKYRPMIRAKLAQHQLPQALEALPMAESAFRYDARSSQGAYGLWQFIPASARRYGLIINAKVDERRDPARATDAALSYLKDINKKFGGISILLSIAAYNAGEGRIRGVVRKSGMSRKTRGYSRVIRFLPKETRGYVPEFLAAALILKNPNFFGFPVSKTLQHDYVQIPKPQTLGKLAKLTNLTRSSLRSLNPELKKLARTPTHNFILRLPRRAALRLKDHLPSSVTWRPIDKTIELKRQSKPKKDVIYTARTGNYLGGIADLFDVKIEDVRKWNNLDGNKIKAGQRLIIRVKKPVTRKHYLIRSGDNLGFIARQLGVPIEHLMFINGMRNARRLKAGDRLFYYERQV